MKTMMTLLAAIFAIIVAGTFFATSVLRELKTSRARRKRQREEDTLAGRKPYNRD